jgi:predicted RNase H-like HicB family nuclease
MTLLAKYRPPVRMVQYRDLQVSGQQFTVGQENPLTGCSEMTKTRLTAVVWEEDGVFVSKCPEIEVSSVGDTVEEAISNLVEAIESWLSNARELGIIEDYLPVIAGPEKSMQFIEVDV